MGIHKVTAESGKRKTEMRRAVFLDRDGVINRALERDSKPFAPSKPRRI